jgi:UDP-N-acetylglucosamine 1-carboxyvinyltransferase
MVKAVTASSAPKVTPTVNKITIEGGKPLRGEVVLRGAKNSIPKIMVAALLSDGPSIIHNVADIEDVEIVSRMITAMGGSVKHLASGTIEVSSVNLHPIHYRDLKVIAGKSRIPVLFAGPLLARFQEAFLPELGGCKIGPRPINFHISVLERMGATVEQVPKGIHVVAKRLHGTNIRLEYPSVGTTEQVLLSSVLAEGVTELSNAAVEPEILDLIAVLQKMGAIISVDTDRVITIVGVPKLHPFQHTVIPDRLEAASWASAAAVTGGDIFVRNARQSDMMTFLNKYRQIGGKFEIKDDGIRFWRDGILSPITLQTDVHPGFMTDWQQPFVVVLTQAHGVSIVHETVWEERFTYVSALNQMGAKIQLHRECLGNMHCRFGQRNHLHSAVIAGPTPLKGAEINVPDLRAGFSYVIAALAAEGTSTIHNIGIIGRGYENFLEKLKSLGARFS